MTTSSMTIASMTTASMTIASMTTASMTTSAMSTSSTTIILLLLLLNLCQGSINPLNNRIPPPHLRRHNPFPTSLNNLSTEPFCLRPACRINLGQCVVERLVIVALGVGDFLSRRLQHRLHHLELGLRIGGDLAAGGDVFG
ncbi:hypothetical protein BJY04DRAFT_200288, partial [Aspergillus karnatakaensis]|uniref:uncharacterized protein n=1 Tax=Aspergillus karnatakaensis TaxID=1810916 RepID=UPI003CCE019F